MQQLATGQAATPTLAVVILTYNEERHIARAIASVRALATEIVVVDSYSKDRTVELAAAAGARVLQNPFVTQAKQFQWAMDHAGLTADWVLRLDADEVIGEDLAAALHRELPRYGADVAGVNFARRHIFMGRWIRHGGRYPLWLLRLFRRGQGRVEDRWMDEHIVVWGGRTESLHGVFEDRNLHDLGFFTAKHNAYAVREAVDVLIQRHRLAAEDAGVLEAKTSGQAKAKRWIKQRVYNRLPFGVGPFALWVYRYFAKLGFLDGREGLIYHTLQGFWYPFLVEAKVLEYEKAMADCATLPERRARLAALSGLPV